jgi:glycosyltransferase involved in cell wall biosynthesis
VREPQRMRSEPLKVAFDWQISSFTGWGVFGLNLALEWAKDPSVEAISLAPLDPRTLGLDPLRMRALKPLIQRSLARAPLTDAIHLHTLGNDFFLDSDAPVGVTFFEKPLSRDAIERARRYELIITGSTWNEEVLRGHGIENVRILQGVDPTLYHPAPRLGLYPDRFLIFSGGKAERRKGQDIVVKAFRIFAERHPDAMLVTAWHSPWPTLRAGMDLDLSAVAERVIDIGAVPNAHMPAIYRECDVALFPNRAEGGTNLVAMECLACGLPAILSANTGHLDLIGRHGVLPLTNQQLSADGWGESDVEEILDALERAYGERARNLASPVADLTWAKTAGAMLDAIHQADPRKGVAHMPAAAPIAMPAVENQSEADKQGELANFHDSRGEWQISLSHLRLAHAAAPQDPQVRLNLAIALLRMGEYREGLALYEARIDKPTWSGFATAQSRAVTRRLLLRPGDPVEGRRLVVLAEQGLGDCIMIARYLPMLAERGARIAVACSPTLRPFFARIPGIEALLSPPPDQPLAQINLAALPFDAWVPLMSLPLWFGADAQSVPAHIPYWRPQEARVNAWHDILARAGRPGAPKIGLVFHANPASVNCATRSMRISDLVPLLALEGLDFVNLQHGEAGRELAAAAPSIIDPLSSEVALDEYAAAIAATDILISVDTMAAHCAGAMGHAVWVGVPYSPHWVWGLDGEATPWYPCARIFRQSEPGDWSSVIAALATHLQDTFGIAGDVGWAPVPVPAD